MSKRKPNKETLNKLILRLMFAEMLNQRNSNPNDYKTIGIGSGQPSRLDSCQIAINKMKISKFKKILNFLQHQIFFPFVDGIEKLVQSGVSAVIQPSGSKMI